MLEMVKHSNAKLALIPCAKSMPRCLFPGLTQDLVREGKHF